MFPIFFLFFHYSQIYKQNHITKCGQVLENCPNNCNAYVQRRRIETHLKDCPKSPQSSIDVYNTPVTNGLLSDDDGFQNRLLILEQDIRSLRSTLNEEIRQRHRLISDVGGLRKRNIVADEWTQKAGEVLNALKKCLNEETDIRTVDIEQLKVDIGRLMYHYKVNLSYMTINSERRGYTSYFVLAIR